MLCCMVGGLDRRDGREGGRRTLSIGKIWSVLGKVPDILSLFLHRNEYLVIAVTSQRATRLDVGIYSAKNFHSGLYSMCNLIFSRRDTIESGQM